MQTSYLHNLGLRFEQIAEDHGGRPALVFGAQQTVTYAELAVLARRVARFLFSCGIRPGDVVCIAGIKKPQTYASMLACLFLGAVYVVMDDKSPLERLRKITTRCRPKLLLLDGGLLPGFQGMEECRSMRLVGLESELLDAVAHLESTPLESLVYITGENPAYVMFTSGSTGLPKGAVMTHANVLNLAEWSKDAYGITPEDVLSNVNPLYFDNSVFDFYSALMNGAALAVVDRETLRSPRGILDALNAAGCTSWFSVPSLLIFLMTTKVLHPANVQSITRFIFGGEGFPKLKLKQLFDAFQGSASFHNVYGPTECTCICSTYRITESDFADSSELPSLGSIARNFSFLILDGDQPAPTGEAGELCLLGPNVGKGYYNDPERTAAAFVQNPLNQAHREFMYRTGDLVRLNPDDGKLYFVGRKDYQIKHMGYRIELLEVESAFNSLPYVVESCVVHGLERGFSCIAVMASVHAGIDVERIRADVRTIIPDYMVPSKVVLTETLLPKNQNGKIDRTGIRAALFEQN